MRKMLTSVVTFVAVLSMVLVAVRAGEGEGVPGGAVRKHGEGRIPHEGTQSNLRQALNLTDAQAKAISQEQENFSVTRGQIHEQIEHLEMQTFEVAQTGNAEAVGQVVLQRIALQKQLESEEASVRQRINAILTAEQQDKLKQMMEAAQAFGGEKPGLLESLGSKRHPREIEHEK